MTITISDRTDDTAARKFLIGHELGHLMLDHTHGHITSAVPDHAAGPLGMIA